MNSRPLLPNLRHGTRLAALAVSLCAAYHSTFVTHAAEPPSKPILRIEAGMHTASIKRIATDAAGRVALTCSDDKTAKLWSLERGKEGTLLRTFRCPIGEGNEGRLYACALSPDGKLAAVGGCATQDRDDSAAHHIYLFDTATGQLAAPSNSSRKPPPPSRMPRSSPTPSWSKAIATATARTTTTSSSPSAAPTPSSSC